MSTVSFTCDYCEGAHPLILEALAKTNMIQEQGYGEDAFCRSARERIRADSGCPEAGIYFLVCGTQANSTIIDAMLRGYEGVIAAQTGHIAVHEAGAVEFSGHKVLTLPQHAGKIDPAELEDWLRGFHADETWPHMVFPGMVYISFPTEYGTIYSKEELSRIFGICRQYGIPLFIDGARLGYGLASPACDLTLPELAQLCDVFYIGGTKVGALCGEVVVFPRGNVPPHFFTTVKQHGALLAKGRLLGVQFDTLFTDDLYFRISRNAIDMAMRVKELFKGRLYIDSPTNQQFPILTADELKSLDGKFLYEIWEKLPDGRFVTRFATSWATTEEQVALLEQAIDW